VRGIPGGIQGVKWAMANLGRHEERQSSAKILLALARWGHKCLPFAQLRTVNWILRLNGGQQLALRCRLFDYELKLQADRSPVHAMLYLRGEDFVEDAAVLAPYLQPGMTVFDVGANIGYLTYFFCRCVEPGGIVFSFEPDAANFGELVENVKRNNITSCYPLQLAVGFASGTVCFVPGLNGHIDEGTGLAHNCRLISLDSFLEQRSLSRVDLVKIDVEGWELDVLEGMRGILTGPNKPILYVEVHPQGFLGKGDPEAVCCFLQKHYRRITAFRTWSDVRGGLPAWRRLGRSLLRDAGHPQPIPLSELRQRRLERFQLLCLPEKNNGHHVGRLV